MPKADYTTKKQKQILKAKNEHPHLSTRELAKVCDTSNSYVSEVLQTYKINYKSLQDWKEHKADILEGLSNRLLSSITNEDIQKATIQQRIVSAGILLDKMNEAKGLAKVVPMVTINMIGVEQRPDNDQIVTLDNKQFTPSTVIENTTTNDINNLGN